MNVYTGPYDWRDDAACSQIGGNAWFPEKGTDSLPARKICRRCPVIDECLKWALETKPSHGIYAGLSINQLGRLRKKERAA